MTEKQYPELPEPTAWRSYDNLLKRVRYNAMPITSMQPGIYSHTRMFTEDQMYAYVDADRAMRAAQAAPASQDALDAAKHCLEMGESFRALRRIVNLLLDARRNLGPEDHELRDRIDRLLRDDAARAAQGESNG